MLFKLVYRIHAASTKIGYLYILKLTASFLLLIFKLMHLKQKIKYAYIKTKFNLLSKLSTKMAAQKVFKLFCTPLLYKPTIVLSKQFQEAEQLQFTLHKNNVKGYRFNHPQHKRVLIVHGFQSAAFKFDHIVKHCIDLGYEVLIFDAPAHGNSSGKRLHALLYKEMIQQINELYGPIDAYITHSLGGLATSLALEEKNNATQKLILIAPATETTSAIKMLFKLLPLSKKVQQAFEQVIYAINNQPSSWYSVARVVPQLKSKVLWIHDKNDAITPFEDAKKTLDMQLPHVQFIVTEHLGHQKIYRNQGVLEHIKTFLLN